jgi:aminocarboxymuconate-semialdehyde decarboxylase
LIPADIVTLAIDIHTHVVPIDFPAYGGRHGEARWPQMRDADCGHRSVIIDGKVFRTVSRECWDIDRRRAAMTAAGISHQVLSPMPELLSYWLASDDALSLCRHLNDTIGNMVDNAPDFFSGLGCVPLQDLDLAIGELERLMSEGRFKGVEIGTNVNGVAIGDPRFEPFFAAAETLGAAIFVHALHPAGLDRLVGPPALAQLVAFPGENALAIASMITGGTLDRHPELRIAFSHGGGGFALTLPRLMFGWQHLGFGERIARSPVEQARSVFYDTLVYDKATLLHLIEKLGITQLCLGTDHPFAIQDVEPVSRIDALNLTSQERELLLRSNARRFLGECC